MPENKMVCEIGGCFGSLPAPKNAEDVRGKIVKALLAASKANKTFSDEEEARQWALRSLPFETFGTYGGNTTSLQVRCGDLLIIIDMGSGLRVLGKKNIQEAFKSGGITVNVLMSHIHWDHIQGLPFYPLLYVLKAILHNNLHFYGGTNWMRTLEETLKGQMDPPAFPVEWEKIIAEGPYTLFYPIHDQFMTSLVSKNEDTVKCLCARLNHPNETYGWRLEHNDKIFTFASDTEPYRGDHNTLLKLAKSAHVLYLDCQYSEEMYLGKKDGVSRQGWGHGYDKWCAEVAHRAQVQKLILGHHDPSSSDDDIRAIREATIEELKKLGSPQIEVVSAFDGMTFEV